ncbi:MAG TPA: hypothetical protein GXX75_18395 [Clostridiales bacterium]|nr:hypothetical protein [Clostridiales bacterium]
MPWCPNCKAEYQPGFTLCSDCKIELVDDIKEAEVFIPFFQAEDKKVAEKLVKFFDYSDLQSSLEYDEESSLYVVSVPPKKQQEAKKLYQAFYYVERERLEKGESDLFAKKSVQDIPENDQAGEPAASGEGNAGAEETGNHSAEPEEPSPEDEYKEITPGDEINAFDEKPEPAVYVMKADQYKDLTGTVWIFLIFGIAGLVIVLLNVIGVLNFFSGWIPNTVMGALFLFFLYVAISTNNKAKKVQAEIDAENQLTGQINDWLTSHITQDFLSSLHDENISEELNYIRTTDKIKDMLIEEFGNQNLAYLDRLIEEYYNENF